MDHRSMGFNDFVCSLFRFSCAKVALLLVLFGCHSSQTLADLHKVERNDAEIRNTTLAKAIYLSQFAGHSKR